MNKTTRTKIKVPQDQETKDQVKAIMLLHGTPEQQKQVLDPILESKRQEMYESQLP